MNMTQEFKEMTLALKLLDSNCLLTEVGNEAIDPKVFLLHLRKITEKSTIIVKKLLENSNVAIEYTPKSNYALNQKVLKTPFLKACRNTIYVPLNFKGTMSEFTKLMKMHKKDILHTQQCLLDANAVFSQYLTNPSLLAKLDPKSLPKLPSLKELPKDFAEFFKGKEGVDMLVMEEVYLSYNDFNTVTEDLESLSKDLQNIQLKEIKKKVDDFYDTLDMLMSKLDNGEISVSKPVAKSMGELIYQMADWMAIFSLYITKMAATTRSHQDTAEKLNGLV